ncbi:glycosyltransferase [Patescibacteria group bacterium]|nr:glycosyltransferase [Patescibacteria group bacterium]
MNKNLTISVIITNWNGLRLIKKSLPKILENSPEAKEVIFSDDASNDGSVLFVKKLQRTDYRLKLIVHQHNQGFARNTNYAVKKAVGDLVVLLNSDIHPHPHYLKAAIVHFSDPQVFGVGFAEHHKENWARIFWKEGTLQYEPGIDIKKSHITAWLSGGSSIIRKEYFLKLDGFDEIYSPFYSEDLDLGYRAWKSGYKLLWEPASIVDHQHEATTSKFPKSYVESVKERNRLLVVWRNITDPSLLSKNRLSLFYRTIFGPNYIKVISAASHRLKQFPKPIVFPVRTDREIFDFFKKQ